jgi:hypothetical protein
MRVFAFAHGQGKLVAISRTFRISGEFDRIARARDRARGIACAARGRNYTALFVDPIKTGDAVGV